MHGHFLQTDARGAVSQGEIYLDRPGKAHLKHSMEFFQWSGRAYHRILRVARTIADLAGSERILEPHVGEAVQYRRALRDR